MEFAPAEGGFGSRLQRLVDGGEGKLDQFGGGVPAGRLVSMQRHADEGIVRPEQAANRREGVHGMLEIVADAAEAVVELGRAVNGNGHHQAGPHRLLDFRRHLLDPFGGDAVGGKMHEEQIGAGAGEGLHHLRKIRPVGRLPAREIDPLKIRVGGRDGLHLVQRELAVEPAGRVLDLPDVAVDAARVAALGDDEDELGGPALDPCGGGGGAQRKTAPGVKGAHGPGGDAAPAGASPARARARWLSRSVSRRWLTGGLAAEAGECLGRVDAKEREFVSLALQPRDLGCLGLGQKPGGGLSDAGLGIIPEAPSGHRRRPGIDSPARAFPREPCGRW